MEIYKNLKHKKIKIIFKNDIHNLVIGNLSNIFEYNLVLQLDSKKNYYFESICYELIKESYLIKNDIKAYNNWINIKNKILVLNDDVKNYITSFLEGEYEIKIN